MNIKFSDVPIGSIFRETCYDPDIGIKTSDDTAKFDYCAPGFCVSMRQDEIVEVPDA